MANENTSKNPATAAAEVNAEILAMAATPAFQHLRAQVLGEAANLSQTQINAIMAKATEDTTKAITAGLDAKAKAGLLAEFDKASDAAEVNVVLADGKKIRVPAKKIEPSWTDKGIYKWGALTLSALLGAGAGVGGTLYVMGDNEPSST